MRIHANGIEIHYELSGNPDGPVVVLSHCLASSMVMWAPQLPALEPFCRVLRYDMRGHGHTEVTTGEYTLELLADDVIGLLDALDIRRAHFIGLSIGGMIGQGLALDHSDRLESVALCATVPVLPEEARPLFEERMQRARDQGMASLAEETLARWFTAPFREKAPPILSRIKDQILATPVAGFIGCCHAILGLDYRDRLAGIESRPLVIVGEDDPGTPVAAAEAICAKTPNAELVVLPSAAHLANIEQAEKFNRVVLDFMQRRGGL